MFIYPSKFKCYLSLNLGLLSTYPKQMGNLSKFLVFHCGISILLLKPSVLVLLLLLVGLYLLKLQSLRYSCKTAIDLSIALTFYHHHE